MKWKKQLWERRNALLSRIHRLSFSRLRLLYVFFIRSFRVQGVVGVCLYLLWSPYRHLQRYFSSCVAFSSLQPPCCSCRRVLYVAARTSFARTESSSDGGTTMNGVVCAHGNAVWNIITQPSTATTSKSTVIIERQTKRPPEQNEHDAKNRYTSFKINKS